jgi:peptidoglycan/xylan/chitin deacetylase (PgdA/CDA1 family)
MRWRVLLGLCLISMAHPAPAEDHAVILLYHRVSDTGPDSTRVSPARFAAHLDLIREQGYQVLPLAELLEAVYGDRVLPDKAVAISFDDAYRSVGETAYPMLRERNMPFTVFVATDVVDQQSSAFLDWSALKNMAKDTLVSFGPHSRSHAHLESLGLDANARAVEIDGSFARLRNQLGDTVINAFAYPYGEYSLLTEGLLADRGLYGLAQQSGAVAATTSATRIPRFPFYVGGDSDSRLLTALGALSLRVVGEDSPKVFFPSSSLPDNRWRFEPGAGNYRAESLRCFAASGEPLEHVREGEQLVVLLPQMRPGRNKVNCTAPAIGGQGYYWYSRLWLIGDAGEIWLRE